MPVGPATVQPIAASILAISLAEVTGVAMGRGVQVAAFMSFSVACTNSSGFLGTADLSPATTPEEDVGAATSGTPSPSGVCGGVIPSAMRSCCSHILFISIMSIDSVGTSGMQLPFEGIMQLNSFPKLTHKQKIKSITCESSATVACVASVSPTSIDGSFCDRFKFCLGLTPQKKIPGRSALLLPPI